MHATTLVVTSVVCAAGTPVTAFARFHRRNTPEGTLPREHSRYRPLLARVSGIRESARRSLPRAVG